MKYRLADICTKIGSGATPRGGKGSYCKNGISLVRSQNVLDFSFSPNGLAYISKEQAEKLNNVELTENDVLLNITGDSVARTCMMDIAYLPARVNQHVAIIRGNPDKVFNSFLLYYLQWQKEYLLQLASAGGTRNALTKGMIEQLVINLPPLEQQKKVISILDLLQAKIELNQKINDNLEQQTFSLYNHLITSADWPIVIIADIAEKIAMGPFGSNIKVSTFVPRGVPIISGNHLRGLFLEEPGFNYITEEHAERLRNSIVYPRDLIFTHAGNIGQVAMIPEGSKYSSYVLSQRQFYLRCDRTKVVPELLLMFFHSMVGQHELLSYANRTGVPSIAQPATNLKKIPFRCPPLSVQMTWWKMVKPLIQKYLSNRKENECLSSLRDILIPKLLSSEIDVSAINIKK